MWIAQSSVFSLNNQPISSHEKLNPSVIFLFARIERLELFDEFEEWHMMQASLLLSSVWKA